MAPSRGRLAALPGSSSAANHLPMGWADRWRSVKNRAGEGSSAAAGVVSGIAIYPPPSMIGPYIRLYISSTSGDHGDGFVAQAARRTAKSAARVRPAYRRRCEARRMASLPFRAYGTLRREIWPAVQLDPSAVTQQKRDRTVVRQSGSASGMSWRAPLQP
jgi:hypothetical protein